MTSVGDIADTARGSIGRYFSLVSALPSVLLVCYVFVLIVSNGWSGRPNWRRAVDTTTHLGVGGALALVAVSIGVALALHPLQFAMVQLLEGYWGANSVAERVRAARMKHHWQRAQALMDRRAQGEDGLEELEESGDSDDAGLSVRMRLVSRIAETGRVLQAQPVESAEAMPTRLGIVLRHYESYAGDPFGLNAIQVMPYLARVARPDDMAYVNDQRSQMDLAVRMSVTAMAACLLTIVVLWRSGLWLFVALVPYAVSYLAYRGAVVAAGQYGRAVAVVIALNRFALYERLHFPLPGTAAAERAANGALNDLMDYNSEFMATYRHPRPPSDNRS